MNNTEEHIKTSIKHLYECMQSVTFDNSFERKEYIRESFNNEWFNLFNEEEHFKE